MARRIACLGDGATHPGSLIVSNQDGTVSLNNIVICVDGATFACQIHGYKSVAAVTQKSTINGKLVLTTDAVAQCGAIMTPPDRKVYCE